MSTELRAAPGPGLAGPPHPLLPYARLVRIPNVFTALADIGLGGFATWAIAPEFLFWPGLIALLASSACLYSAGMVWNDFFDVEQDRRERPFRPLPSGQVPRSTAGFLGAALLLAGIALAGSAGMGPTSFNPRPLLVAFALAATILLYDGWLKRTLVGPLVMGSCRALNILLGLSMTDTSSWPWLPQMHLAVVVGVYIVGVTWFARTEARLSSQQTLLAASLVMGGALGLALAVPVGRPVGTSSPLFPYLLVAFGFYVGVPLVHAIKQPLPRPVQTAVKRAVLGLILLDAILATAVAGTVGLALVILLLPALYLGKWVYST